MVSSTNKNIKIINSTKPIQPHERSKDGQRRWVGKQQRIVPIKTTQKSMEKPGNT
jgi:hypothetical protein